MTELLSLPRGHSKGPNDPYLANPKLTGPASAA
jgi:hypothetical protein